MNNIGDDWIIFCIKIKMLRSCCRGDGAGSEEKFAGMGQGWKEGSWGRVGTRSAPDFAGWGRSQVLTPRGGDGVNF